MLSRLTGVLLGGSIRGWVVRFLLVVGLVPLLSVVVYLTFWQRGILQDAASDDLATQAQLEASQVERTLSDGATSIQTLSENPILQSPTASRETKLEEMLEAQEFTGAFEDVTLIDTQGQVIESTTYLFSGTWSEKAWYAEALAGRPSVSEAHLVASPRRLVVVFTAPVMTDGQVSAVIAGQMNMEVVWEDLDSITIGDTGFLMAIDRNGNLVSHPDKYLLLTKLTNVVTTEGSETSPVNFTGPDQSLVGQAAAVGVLGWHVIAAQESAETYAIANDIARTVAVVLVIVMVLTAGAILFFSRVVGRAEQALRLTRFSLERTADSVFWISPDGHFVDVNDAACGALGYSREELLSMTVDDIDAGDLLGLRHERWNELKQHGSQVFESSHRTRDGKIFPVEVSSDYLEFNGKEYDCAIVRDITERKQAEEKLRESEARSSAIVETAHDCIITIDHEGRITEFNPAAERTFGYSRTEALGQRMVELIVPPSFREGHSKGFAHHLATGEGAVIGKRIEITAVRADGTEIPVELTVTRISADPPMFTGHLRDITERKTAEETISHLAYYDGLTDLPNRALFIDRVNVALTRARRTGQMAAVMFLDLDRFKLINDTVGHGLGDEVLRSVAHRLTGLVREGDTVARASGDEFTLLLPDIEQPEDVFEVAERIVEAFRRPWLVDGREFHVTGSLGIAMYPDDGDDPESLLRKADTAMYQAKDEGRDTYRLHTEAMNARIAERVDLEAGLRRGLERSEFVVHYQPQVDLQSGAIVGAEALVRWQHPEQGLLLPGGFIPVAEDCGLILPLGEWVLRTVCAQNVAWQQTGDAPMPVAVNLSARQFQERNLLDTVTQVLEESGMDPQYLQLEITEGAAMRDVESTITTLRALRKMGVQIAIDDFGTGYSSLSYLKRFPIDVLKIDRSFVRDLIVDPDDAAIASAIIAMAKSLGLRVIAEGVETEEQLAYLKEHGCDEMQGYLFSKPVPAPEFTKMMSQAERSSPAEVSADSP